MKIIRPSKLTEEPEPWKRIVTCPNGACQAELEIETADVESRNTDVDGYGTDTKEHHFVVKCPAPCPMLIFVDDAPEHVKQDALRRARQ